jgi:hypothetical protein
MRRRAIYIEEWAETMGVGGVNENKGGARGKKGMRPLG